MNNAERYGIRFHSMRGGGNMVKSAPYYGLFASGYQPAVNGGGNVNIGSGDPITGLATGMVQLAAGFEAAAGAAEAIKGVIVGCEPQWSSSESAMVLRDPIQGGIVYGTNLERQTKCTYMPADLAVWEMDVVNASTTYDTIAEYQAAYGTNADHRLAYDSAAVRAKPQLDLATVATTTAQWRLQTLSPTSLNMDLTGTAAKMLVTVFELQTAGI